MQCVICDHCHLVLRFTGVLVPCHCGAGVWRTVQIVGNDEPKKSYAISQNDRRFLRSLRIAAEG